MEDSLEPKVDKIELSDVDSTLREEVLVDEGVSAEDDVDREVAEDSINEDEALSA